MYYDDYPCPSCLVLGYDINNKILHVVCGVSEETVHMITAYYPSTDKWKEDMKYNCGNCQWKRKNKHKK